MIYVYKGDIFAFDSSNYRLGQQKASKHLKDGRDITQITYLYRKLLVFNYCQSQCVRIDIDYILKRRQNFSIQCYTDTHTNEHIHLLNMVTTGNDYIMTYHLIFYAELYCNNGVYIYFISMICKFFIYRAKRQESRRLERITYSSEQSRMPSFIRRVVQSSKTLFSTRTQKFQ